jgi:transposase
MLLVRVITASESWVGPFTGLSMRAFRRLVRQVRRRGGTAVADGRPGRRWALCLDDRVRDFGVGLSVVSVGRLLHKLGLSAQRPLYRAYQQDPAAVEAWKTQTYPGIRAEAEQVGAVIYFCDEAGIRSDYHAGTTSAPVGRTPVVKTTGARHAVNMISAVTAQGALRFAVYDGTLTATAFIDFCTGLLHDAPGPVFLIVDGHPAHRATATKKFVAGTDGRLRLFLLPGYPPELNPDERVWKNVKHDRIARAGITSAEDLKTKAIGALRRLQELPHLVRGFLADPTSPTSPPKPVHLPTNSLGYAPLEVLGYDPGPS